MVIVNDISYIIISENSSKVNRVVGHGQSKIHESYRENLYLRTCWIIYIQQTHNIISDHLFCEYLTFVYAYVLITRHVRTHNNAKL